MKLTSPQATPHYTEIHVCHNYGEFSHTHAGLISDSYTHTQYSTSTIQQYHPGSGSKMFSKCSSFMRLRTQSISGAERVGDVRSKMHAGSSGAGSQAGLGSRVRPQHITHHTCTDHSTSHITPAQVQRPIRNIAQVTAVLITLPNTCKLGFCTATYTYM